jgi:hypothetical protein
MMSPALPVSSRRTVYISFEFIAQKSVTAMSVVGPRRRRPMTPQVVVRHGMGLHNEGGDNAIQR